MASDPSIRDQPQILTMAKSTTSPPASFHQTGSTMTQGVNVVLFGDTDVGKSSVINLIAQKEVAKVSSDIRVYGSSYTTQSTRYDISFDGMYFSIFDTMGLGDPGWHAMGVNSYLEAVEKAYELIVKLGAAGGIHLLLFCIRAGRIAPTTQSNYRLFCECLCNEKVPIALVFTHLEREHIMENWWERNKRHIEYYGIRSDGHACIIAVEDLTPEDHKYEQSQTIIRDLLKECALKNEAFLAEQNPAFARLGKGMMSFIAKQRSPKQKDAMKVLTHRCKLDPETARKIADIMEKCDTEKEEAEARRMDALAVMDAAGNRPSTPSPNDVVAGPHGAEPEGNDKNAERHTPELSQNEVKMQLHTFGLEGKDKNGGGKTTGHRTLALQQSGAETDDMIVRLEKVVQQLRNDLSDSQRIADELKGTNINILLRSQETRANVEIARLKQDNQDLRGELANCQRAADEHEKLLRSQATKSNDAFEKLKQANQDFQYIIRAHEQMRQCDALHVQGRSFDSAELLLKIQSTMDEHIKANQCLSDWLTDSTAKCIRALETTGDEASRAEKWEAAAAAYSAALSLDASATSTVLTKWARMILTGRSARRALDATENFKVPMFDVYRAICTILEEDSRLMDLVEILRQMQTGILGHTSANNEQVRWESAFRERCVEALVKLGDTARDAKVHIDAIKYYSGALSLRPVNFSEILFRRSNELIERDPSLHIGYEQQHAALHGLSRYTEAFEAFQLMLSALRQSPEPRMRELRRQYVDATSTIQKEVEAIIRDLPTVLIDTDTGRLYDKTHLAAAFKELPVYDELRSSMTAALDRPRIQAEVKRFYRYVMFSHKWQFGEPTFQKVENDSVYSLPPSPTFDKLRNFCKLVVALQYKWAWSDTCCVNQLDKGVQQESIVAMFRWYRQSSITIVHLLGVLSESQEPGCLWRSIWNTRGWTYQEYVASVVVQFYSEDWRPYLGLQIFNHKESPDVLSEMERATNVATQQLITLRPGLDRAREKLYLASGRQTTREEDMAYSLFGIFGVSLPVVYGEGNLAISRLLEHILTRSKEVTLLAWTGHSSSQCSYLPASLTVYNEIVPPHVPAPIETSEMNRMVPSLRSSFPDLSLVVGLYQRLYHLRLSLVGGHLNLPGILFQLGELTRSESNVRVYHTMTPLLGEIKIETTADLAEMSDLCLIHPWISPLIDQDFSRGKPLFDQPTRALRLLVRLRQPFGGLLLALSAREEYKRVAADSLIMVRVREEAPLSELMDAVCMANIL